MRRTREDFIPTLWATGQVQIIQVSKNLLNCAIFYQNPSPNYAVCTLHKLICSYVELNLFKAKMLKRCVYSHTAAVCVTFIFSNSQSFSNSHSNLTLTTGWFGSGWNAFLWWQSWCVVLAAERVVHKHRLERKRERKCIWLTQCSTVIATGSDRKQQTECLALKMSFFISFQLQETSHFKTIKKRGYG